MNYYYLQDLNSKLNKIGILHGRRVISERQMNIMLDYMETYPEFAKGPLPYVTTFALKKEMKARWQNLACSLNAAGSGCKKNAKQWREYWNTSKYSARRKAGEIRKQLKELMTGKPNIKLYVLTKYEERVLRILGTQLPELPLLGESPPDITQPNAPPDTSPEASPPEASPPETSLPEASPPENSPPEASPPETSSPKASPLETSPPEASPPETSPPEASSREVSPPMDTPPLAMSQPAVSVQSELDMSHSISPLLERRPPPTKVATAQAIKRKAAYESATSTTRVYSTPYGSTARKRYRTSSSKWIRHIEERRIAVEERSSRALQGIQANTEFCASALQGIHITQERMNRTLKGIRFALEASTRALQERLS